MSYSAHERTMQDHRLLRLLTNAADHLGYTHLTLDRSHWEYGVNVRVKFRPRVHAGQLLGVSYVISDCQRESLRGQEELLVKQVLTEIQHYHMEAAMAYALQRSNKETRYAPNLY